MAALELLKTLPLGETAMLCTSLQKWLRLRSTCEVRAVTENTTKDVTARTWIQSKPWLTKNGSNPAVHGARRGKAGTESFSGRAPRRAPCPPCPGRAAPRAGGSGGSAAQRRLCALGPNSPPRAQPQPHGCLQGSEQTSEGKAQASAWEKSPHTSAGRCVGMGTHSKDKPLPGAPACAPAGLGVVSMGKHTTRLHTSPENPSSRVTVGIALIQDGLKRIWSQNHFFLI